MPIYPMLENPQKTVLTVFLASPGDLNPERKVTREIVEELNRSIGRELNIFIDLRGWEDTLPGTGRPQALINGDVDCCDLFIGMLWKRWGSETGEYSSGFEEEFHRAMARFDETLKPEIWMAFKQVDDDQIRDPGPALKKVIEFRSKHEGERKILYKSFRDADVWHQQLREWLSVHLIRHGRNNAQKDTEISSIVSSISLQEPRTEVIEELSEMGEKQLANRPVSTQLAAITEKIFQAVSNTDSEAFSEFVVNMTPLEKIRLQLFSKSLMAQSQTRDSLPLHDLNLAYLQREKIELVYPESAMIFRTVLQKSTDTLPGWFWLRQWPEIAVSVVLFMRTTNTYTSEERVNAFQLLAFIRSPVDDDSQSLVNSALTAESPLEVQIAALEYLEEIGDTAQIAILEKFSPSVSGFALETLERVRRTLVGIRNPLELVAEVTEGKIDLDTATVATIKSHTPNLPFSILQAALASPQLELRKTAASELFRRNELTIQAANNLTVDSDPSLRGIGFKAKVYLGEHMTLDEIQAAFLSSPAVSDDVNIIVLALLEKYDLQALDEEIRWLSVYGNLAYSTLGKRFFDQRANQIREDLQTRFTRLEKGFLESLNTTPTQKILETDTNEFIRERYVVAGLEALAINDGMPSDVELAQSAYLETGLLKSKALLQVSKILRRHGTSEQVPWLLSAANECYADAKIEALQTAISLLSEPEEIAFYALKSDDIQVSRIALLTLTQHTFDKISILITPLLKSENGSLRLTALACLAKIATKADLELILNIYTKEGRYYYDVVCWLDRLLYSPEPLRSAYQKHLEGNLHLNS
jgi:Domain of unknown function (DUF4062)